MEGGTDGRGLTSSNRSHLRMDKGWMRYERARNPGVTEVLRKLSREEGRKAL